MDFIALPAAGLPNTRQNIRLSVRERKKFWLGSGCQKIIVGVSFLIAAAVADGEAPKASLAKTSRAHSGKPVRTTGRYGQLEAGSRPRVAFARCAQSGGDYAFR